jgi:iron(III) transport system substrate-binding protein
MPNPASSGTGYLDVSSWLQVFGEEGGWKYMDGLHENIAQYTHSGSKPCRQSGAGEFVVGISFDFRGNDVKQKGAPVELIFPREGLGWDIEAAGIVKTTQKMDAAHKLMDWVASRDANEAFAKNFAIVAHPEVKPVLAHLPPDLEKRLIVNDFAYAAKNRDRILAEWQKRYAVKTEK